MGPKEIRFYKDVIVQQDNVPPARNRYPRVTRRGDARFLFVNQPQRRRKMSPSNNFIGVVITAIVNHNQFPRLGKLLL